MRTHFYINSDQFTLFFCLDNRNSFCFFFFSQNLCFCRLIVNLLFSRSLKTLSLSVYIRVSLVLLLPLALQIISKIGRNFCIS